MKKGCNPPGGSPRRRAVLRQQRAEGVEQRQMLSLQRGSFFRDRQRLRRHGEGEMTNNGANGVLMPVVDGKAGPAIRLQKRQLEKLTLLGL